MDGARHNALAGAGFTQQKNGCVHRGHLLDPQEYLRESIALADDLAEVVLPGDLMLQVHVLGLQPVLKLFYFGKRILKRTFRLQVSIYFPCKLCIRLDKSPGPFLYGLFQLLVVII